MELRRASAAAWAAAISSGVMMTAFLVVPARTAGGVGLWERAAHDAHFRSAEHSPSHSGFVHSSLVQSRLVQPTLADRPTPTSKSAGTVTMEDSIRAQRVIR